MPSSSAIDLAEIRRSSNISSWIWSIISWVFTVLGRPGRGASQVEKSPRLNWVTQFWRWHTMVHVPLMFLSEWRNFLRHLALQEKKTWRQLGSRCCWNGARRLTCFLSAYVTRKYLQFGTWTDPSFQRHYRFRSTTLEIGRAKDLSAPFIINSEMYSMSVNGGKSIQEQCGKVSTRWKDLPKQSCSITHRNCQFPVSSYREPT